MAGEDAVGQENSTYTTSNNGHKLHHHSAYGLPKTAVAGKNWSVKRLRPNIKHDLSKRCRRNQNIKWLTYAVCGMFERPSTLFSPRITMSSVRNGEN